MLSTYFKNIFIFLLIVILFYGFIASSSDTFATHRNSSHCGNGVCQASQEEDINSCPADCGMPPTPTPQPTNPPPPPNPTSTPQPTSQPSNPPNPPSTPQPTETPQPSSSPGTVESPTPTSTSGSDSGNSSPSDSSSNSQNTSEASNSSPSISSLSYPTITLTPYSSDPTNNTTPAFTGSVSVGQGTISQVEYSTDNGVTWIQALPADGSFNNSIEGFTFKTSDLSEGTYTILARAKNSEGVYTKSDQYAKDSLTIITTPPSIIFDSILPNPTKDQTPTISAQAFSKLAGIQKTEISIDGGKSWFTMTKLGNKYSHKFSELEDGNYPIVVRAFDTAGNIAVSKSQTLVIDTIPPVAGGGFYSLGPLVLKPDKNGIISLVAGAENTYILSMKGGVTQAQVAVDSKTFDLIQQPGTSLWYGKLKFDKAGESKITISATDGANNKTERTTGFLSIKEFGSVFNSKDNAPINNAIISIFQFQPSINEWILWSAQSFGQKNPQTTTKDGEYSFMVPPGKYYLEAKAQGYTTMQSGIIDTDQIKVLNFKLPLNPKPSITLNIPVVGNIFLTVPTIIPDEYNPDGQLSDPAPPGRTKEVFIAPGSAAPDFSLPDLSDKKTSITDFKGKKVLLSFFAPWSPASLEQAQVLSDVSLTFNGKVQIVAISLQESIPRTETFIKRGNYKFKVLADQNGDTAISYKISFLPQHFFINENGIIEEVVTGVLSKEDIGKRLSGMP